MSTLQIRIDEQLKKDADSLFSSLGLDTSTAIRIFLNASLEHNGLPFPVVHKKQYNESLSAIQDARLHRNLNGPYNSAKEAVLAMLED
ncbi:type II toxin-antitoxin system RelB/DinJ family antitoxin [Lachnoanaerobaculum saburreum]|jgi:addiction module antitoxin, relB/dinJ family|uniref:Addiction module antitoxin, RelB/DinJ family n=1 Tax=Lachnoanaerobaculum saburreum DSM 3986 TaxID=887325 RepID=E6LMN4_9FIRM|nr:type II toxin-antitoxin system RelB/DinJ family antitoxin [Lachnoanaerobaculum saburreum]EFU76843.1 addiction module antitoxin, RelB/DinJ family [Lachnoanaerobaculum saburreum DSM 3986]